MTYRQWLIGEIACGAATRGVLSPTTSASNVIEFADAIIDKLKEPHAQTPTETR